MKKTKLFNFLAIGTISTVAVSAPLFALTSCNESKTESNNSYPNKQEFIASDEVTKITVLDNTYKLINPFDNKSIEKLNNSEYGSLLFGVDVPKTLFADEGIFFLENDYLKFLSLLKINEKNISTEKRIIENMNKYGLYTYFEDKNYAVVFSLSNFKFNNIENKITSTLQIYSQNVNVDVDQSTLWTANLGEFTFTNVME